MGIDAISRVAVVELFLDTRPRTHVSAGRWVGGDPLLEDSGPLARSPEGMPSTQSGKEAAELLIGSNPRAAYRDGPDQNYAKIRYDQNTNTVLIQIVNANSGEVMREIPPDAWNRVREAVPLPKGTLVEKEQ